MPDRTRTYNLLLRRQALYPLSYGHAIKHSLSTGPAPKSSRVRAAEQSRSVPELGSPVKKNEPKAAEAALPPLPQAPGLVSRNPWPEVG